MSPKIRYTIPDLLRGIALLCMILYHTLWDLVFIYNVDLPWFLSEGARTFQMGIRWSFLLISGFCWSFGRKPWKRGLVILGCSALITAVTAFLMPESIILFGVLTLIGTGMLATVPLHMLTKKHSPYWGFFLCTVLFLFTLKAEYGVLGFGSWALIRLPDALFANYLTAFLGFYPPGFFSTDYVPLIPWLFLYWVGYFLFRILEKHRWVKHLSAVSCPPLEWIGKRSLLIYMVHQPLIYGILFLIFSLIPG